jgi:excisionase family DNA binding protein
MLNIEIRFVVQGKELSVDSFVEAIVREIRASVSEEISRTLTKQEQYSSDSPRRDTSEMPVQAVSIREAARLLSISTRTVSKYVALKVIRTVRVGRRVLIPMKSVNEVASKGILRRRVEPIVATSRCDLTET